MATATTKARVPRRISRGGGRSSDLQFLIFEDNNGDHRWAIVTSSGEQLAQSPCFASYNDAQNAARRMRDGAGSARFDRHKVAGLPVDLAARRAAAPRDDFDAERWLDEGGAYSAAVATELPPPR